MFLFPSQKKPNTQETDVKQEDIIYQVISVQPVSMNTQSRPEWGHPQLYVLWWLFTEGLDKIVNY